MKSWIKAAQIFLAFAIGLYIILVGFLYMAQRKLLFVNYAYWSAPLEPAKQNVPEMQVIQVKTSDGLVLHNWYAPPTRPGHPVVVLFFAQPSVLGSFSGIARWLLDNGFGVLLANYRGYSGDPGSPTEDGVYKDGRASVEYALAQGYPVSVLGISLGTGIAVQMAAEYDLQSVVLFSPYTSVVDVAAWRFPLVPVYSLMLDKFDSLSKITQVKEPVMILMGTRDGIVPFEHAERLYAAANEPKANLWIDGKGHLNFAPQEFQPQVMEFLKRYATGVKDENSRQ